MLTCSVQICYTGTCAIGYLNFSTRIYGPIVLHIHVFLLAAATKSDDYYTAVYTGVVTFAATALVAVIIVLVTIVTPSTQIHNN
jgi:hypothetical protein